MDSSAPTDRAEPPIGATDRTTLGHIARLVVLGSAAWLVHGILMLLGLVTFLVFFLGVGLQLIGGQAPDLGVTAAASLGAYVGAILLALLGSVLLGLALLAASEAGASRGRIAGALFLVHGAFAGAAATGLVGTILAAIVSDAGLLRIFLILLFAAWLIASPLLVIGAILAHATFGWLRSSPGEPSPLGAAMLVVYSVVHLIGAFPFALALTLLLVATILVTDAAAILGALVALIIAPVLAIATFAHLTVQGLKLRRAAA